MRSKDIRQMGDAEIRSAIEDAKTELFNLRFQRAAGSLENTSRLRALRKDIARLYTILREREIAAALVRQEGKNNG